LVDVRQTVLTPNVLATVLTMAAALASSGPPSAAAEAVLIITKGPCQATPSAYATDVDTIDIFTSVLCHDPAGAPEDGSVFATMSGSLVILGPEKFVSPGEGTGSFNVHPCSLPGGSDLPGAVLTYEIVINKPPPAKNFTFRFTLPDDRAAPVLQVTTMPPPFTKVHTGQVIKVRLMALGEDFSNNTAVSHVYFVTTANVWTGTMHVVVHSTHPALCPADIVVDAQFKLVAGASGAVHGTQSYVSKATSSCGGHNAQSLTNLPVSGQLSNGQFHFSRLVFGWPYPTVIPLGSSQKTATAPVQHGPVGVGDDYTDSWTGTINLTCTTC
jgi:predicted heme/steroid binding protein